MITQAIETLKFTIDRTMELRRNVSNTSNVHQISGVLGVQIQRSIR